MGIDQMADCEPVSWTSILVRTLVNELLVVLRQMAKAFGGVQAVAEQARLNPTQLYRTLSPKGNPALSSLSAILRAMGLRLAVQPLKASTQA